MHFSLGKKRKHPVVNIRKEGCYGSATFNYEKGKWVLDSIQVVEN